MANIKLALHLKGELIKILRVLLYATVMLLRLYFLNLHQVFLLHLFCGCGQFIWFSVNPAALLWIFSQRFQMLFCVCVFQATVPSASCAGRRVRLRRRRSVWALACWCLGYFHCGLLWLSRTPRLIDTVSICNSNCSSPFCWRVLVFGWYLLPLL